MCVCIVTGSCIPLPLCHYLDCHCMYSVYVCVTCVLSGGPDLCAGTPESPEERAGSQGVETMGGEVPPQQPEQAEPSRGVQPHLEEERCMEWGKAHVHIYPYLVNTNTLTYSGEYMGITVTSHEL